MYVFYRVIGPSEHDGGHIFDEKFMFLKFWNRTKPKLKDGRDKNSKKKNLKKNLKTKMKIKEVRWTGGSTGRLISL